MKVRLSGEDGNAYAIMARVIQGLRKADREDLVSGYEKEATSGDYKNLVKASMKVLDEAGIEYS